MTLTTPAPSGMPTDAPPDHPARTPLAPVACAAWCVDADGHTDAYFPEDQVCRGETMEVALSHRPLIQLDEDTWVRETVHLYLLRHPGALRTSVEMYRGELGETVSLTLDEADALGQALTRSVGAARG